MSEDDAGRLAEGSITPLALEVDRDLAGGGRGAESGLELDDAGVGDRGVGAGGTSLEAEVPLVGIGEPERELRVDEREGKLLGVLFEVEASAGGLDVGEAGSWAGFALAGGGGLNSRGLEKDALDVPAAVGGVNEVDAGFGEADGGELDLAAPEGRDAHAGVDKVGADDGLGAEGGIFADDQVLDGKAGEREDREGDAVEVNGTAEAVTDGGGDAALKAADVYKRRPEDERRYDKQYESDVDEAASERGARTLVCSGKRRGLRGGLSVRRCVQWISLLHGWCRPAAGLESYRMT